MLRGEEHNVQKPSAESDVFHSLINVCSFLRNGKIREEGIGARHNASEYAADSTQMKTRALILRDTHNLSCWLTCLDNFFSIFSSEQ